MSNNSRKNRGKLNSKAAISEARVERHVYNGFGSPNEIVPYGVDNLYPDRIIDAIKESPTAKGCVERLRYFIFGQGLAVGGDTTVNREGETLNDILNQSIRDYSKLNGFCLHFNFNALGQIVEIFNVQMEYVRKHKTLDKVDIGIWDRKNVTYYGDKYITLDLYETKSPIRQMMDEGIDNYKGQIYFFSGDSNIYPDAKIEGSTLSAEYEKEAQVYPYANIRNSFSATSIVKLPTLTNGEKSNEQTEALQQNLRSLHGAEHAGSSIVVPVTVGDSGEPKDFKMVENLAPTNVDSLFTNQNASAERALLKTFMMPEILLGVSSSGMFNQAAFNDAFDYKNADTEQDRKIIEREFTKIITSSIFNVPNIEIKPLDMRVSSQLADSVSLTRSETETTVTEEPMNEGNEILRNLTGRQIQAVLNMISKYKNGRITRSELNVFLRAYSLSDEDIEEIISE